jgi:hypothetical protein
MMTGNCVTEFNHSLEEMYCIPCVSEYVPLNDIKIFRSCPRVVHSLEIKLQDNSLQSKLYGKRCVERNATYVTVHIFLSLSLEILRSSSDIFLPGLQFSSCRRSHSHTRKKGRPHPVYEGNKIYNMKKK